MKYYINEKSGLFVNPIVDNHTGLTEITKEEFDSIKDGNSYEKQFRLERDEELAKTDISINKLEDNGEDATTLRQYRQQLRDATLNWQKIW